MRLYGVDLSPFAAACRLAIYAKGLEREVTQVPPLGGDLKSPEYLALNPLGKLPTLDTKGGPIPESMVICEYLEDRFTEPSLLPPSSESRARARLLARMVDLYVYPPLGVLFAQANPKQRDEVVAERGVADLLAQLGHVEHWLSDDGYAVGGTLTLADCSLVPCLFYVRAMLPSFGVTTPFVDHSKLAGYFDRVSQNPHAARVLAELQAALNERWKKSS
jgi:glutathione S-transferase